MAVFHSEVHDLGPIALPAFAGVRVMMLPFHLHDADSLPDTLSAWKPAIATLCSLAPAKHGVGYLTIDEAEVRAGEAHRRPGLHVDGIGPQGEIGGWGGGGGSWGARGMIVAASHMGCRAWAQDFEGDPLPEGDCEHLRAQCGAATEVKMLGGRAYWCGSHAVHESVALPVRTQRQFVRLSMPSPAPWYEGYTVNPLGVLPTGPVHPRRTAQMSFRVS